MQLLRHVDLFSKAHLFPNGCVATIGNFDGVHRAHVALLQKLISMAKEQQLPSVVILFEPQPREVLTPEQAPIRLTPLHEKLRLLAQLPIDYVVCLHFNAQLAALGPREFVEKILVDHLGVRHILIGDDFRFGKQRQGDFALLQALGEKYHFTVASLPTLEENGIRISSTLVRNALASADFAAVQQALGRHYIISGRVRRGAGRGRQWGFPTANIALPLYGLPLSGVFVVRVSSVKLAQHPAVANIGTRPTIDGTRTVLEVLLLDFDDDLYGQRLEIEFLHKLREEKKFPSTDLLLEQIAKDVEEGRQFFIPHPRR